MTCATRDALGCWRLGCHSRLWQRSWDGVPRLRCEWPSATGTSGRLRSVRLSKLLMGPVFNRVGTKLGTLTNCSPWPPSQLIEGIGSSARTRTWNPSVNSLNQYAYLVDFAARLATLNHGKAHSERSSCTDLVLVPHGRTCFRPSRKRSLARCTRCDARVRLSDNTQ
jgi:hypothetical protein